MWSINEIFLVMAAIYVVLGITVGILISKHKRKQNKAPSISKKAQSATSIADSIIFINGRYELKLPPFKQGGMATIWLARERKTGKDCIIKTPRRGTAMDNVYLDKLILESGYLKKLKHPGIVKYLNDFYYKNEFHLILEYLEGETLLASSPRYPFPEEQVNAWACQLLDAVSYIHSTGIVHRDINPKNIMLCRDGTVRLIDFGTAKAINSGNKGKSQHDPFTQITNKGFDIPELCTGGESDQRCDLCGLAQTSIYLLTLNQPNEICSGLFKSSWPRTYSEASSLADYLVSAGISDRTAKCLAQCIMFNPDNRFADAKAMQAALSSAEGYQIKQEEVLVRK
jgi:eukaryotic-like serine/threonine-protein kinase